MDLHPEKLHMHWSECPWLSVFPWFTEMLARLSESHSTHWKAKSCSRARSLVGNILRWFWFFFCTLALDVWRMQEYAGCILTLEHLTPQKTFILATEEEQSQDRPGQSSPDSNSFGQVSVKWLDWYFHIGARTLLHMFWQFEDVSVVVALLSHSSFPKPWKGLSWEESPNFKFWCQKEVFFWQWVCLHFSPNFHRNGFDWKLQFLVSQRHPHPRKGSGGPQNHMKTQKYEASNIGMSWNLLEEFVAWFLFAKVPRAPPTTSKYWCSIANLFLPKETKLWNPEKCCFIQRIQLAFCSYFSYLFIKALTRPAIVGIFVPSSCHTHGPLFVSNKTWFANRNRKWYGLCTA